MSHLLLLSSSLTPSQVIGSGRQVRGRRKDGSQVPLQLRVSETRIGPSIFFLGLLTDLSAQEKVPFILSQPPHHSIQILGQLKDEQAFSKKLMETAVDPFLVIDQQGKIVDCNPAASRTFQYTLEELQGQNVKILMPEPYHSLHDSYLQNYLRTGEKKIIGIGREVYAKKRDGTTFPMELAVSEFIADGQKMVRTSDSTSRPPSFLLSSRA